MKRKYTIAGIIFCIIAGTLLHFVYEWSGYNSAVGAFTPVNESIWEHLKLLFYPVLIYSVFEYFAYAKNISSFVPSRLTGMLLGLLFTVTAFYTYSGITGKSYGVINIIIFILSVLITFIYTSIAVKTKPKSAPICTTISVLVIALFIILFTAFTFNPPHINLFIDPVSGTYGI